MRKGMGISLFILISAAFFAFAGGKITKFELQPGYNKVTLIWEVENERGVEGYEVQRGLNNKDFSKLAFVKAKSTNEPLKKYVYIDKTVFKPGTGSRTFYYRLKIMNEDKTYTYSKVMSVTPTVSSARQTWGMIKAMFR